MERAVEATQILEDIIPAVIRTLGEQHVGVTMTKTNLARAYVLSKKWTEAESLLSGLVNVIPMEHPDAVHNMSGLIHVRTRMGKLIEAEQDCLMLLDSIRSKHILPMNSPRVLAVHEQLLEILVLQGRLEDSESLKKRMPTLRTSLQKRRFDMLPIQKVLRRESELDRLIR
jgi:metal-responsive CopG/Arc/MetJ family transcriptional regulator